jgi:hypothetical protein
MFHRQPINRLGVLMFLFLLVNDLQSEEVLLTNGEIIHGKVVGQSVNDLEIETSKGTVEIAKERIVKVQYKAFTIEQKNEYLEKQKKKRKAIIEKKRQLAKKREENLKKLMQASEIPKNDLSASASNPNSFGKEFDEPIPTEKELEAREVAERASALRELVGKGFMEKPENEPISYWDFAWRSLVFPGWGHFTIDRPVVGGLYMASSFALLAGIYETRQAALKAQNENHRQVEFNYLLSIQNNIAPFEVRTFLVYNANAQAALNFQGKVDAYHNSLYAYGVFYGIQFLHIVYNAIAWENGLLIVKKDIQQNQFDSLKPIFSSHSDLTADGRRETVTTVGIRYVF